MTGLENPGKANVYVYVTTNAAALATQPSQPEPPVEALDIPAIWKGMPGKVGRIRKVYKPGDVILGKYIVPELAVTIVYSDEEAYLARLSEIEQNPGQMTALTVGQRQDVISFLNRCLQL